MLLTLLRSSTRCTGGLSSNVLRAPFRYSSTSIAFSSRGYATSRPPPKNPRRRDHVAKPPSPVRSAGRPPIAVSDNSPARRIQYAERIFTAGDRTLYRSTSRTTFFRVFAWSLSTIAAAGLIYHWQSGLLDINTFKDLKHEYPVVVHGAFILTSVFLGAALGWTVMRSWNHVHSIDLVQKAGSTLLQVTVRSGIPFVKRRVTIPPQRMVVDARFVAAYGLPAMLVPAAPSESSPSAFTAGVLRETMKAFSRFFYSIFDGARIFFSSEGIITVEIKDESRPDRSTKYFIDASALYLQEQDKIVLWDIIDTKDPYGFR